MSRIIYIFRLQTVIESTWKILKLDWKSSGKQLDFFSFKRVGALKKLTTQNNVFVASVLLFSKSTCNCHILQFLHQMFNVSTLLLDDAFKPATPLTNGVINETLRQFAALSDISQGSVATHLKYGGIFSDGIIANFLLILTVK